MFSGIYDAQGPCITPLCFDNVGLYRNQNPWQYKKKVLSFSPVIKKFTVAKTESIPYNPSMLNRKGRTMTEFESKCYGMSEQDIQDQYLNSITARFSGLEMVAMSVLSDAQELMACNTARTQDLARKNINIAKFILSTIMEQKNA